MSDKTEKKNEPIKVDGLGEVVLLKNPATDKEGNPQAGVYTMSQKELDKFYESNGVPEAKKVFGAIDDANEKLACAAAKFLGEKVKKDKQDWELRMGIGNRRCVAAFDAEKNVRNVQTGEVTTKHAVFSFVNKQKAPTNCEMLKKICSDVEAAFK